MQIITNKELNSTLLKFLEGLDYYYPATKPLFQLLYNKGFRSIEVNDLQRFTIVSETELRFKPAKNNNYRTFLISDFPSDFIVAIRNKSPKYISISCNTMRYTFNNLYKYRKVFSGKKEISLHLFRYNFCRKLYDSGESCEQIGARLGEIDLSNLDSYLFADIYRL
jgi:site-specific recombinase XerD